MTRRLPFPRLAALLLALAGTACDDGIEPPVPGTVLLSLATPVTDDGAAAVTLHGPGISNVQSANSSHSVFWRIISEEEVRVIILGAMEDGPVLTAQVADVRKPALYWAELSEVASRTGELRTDVRGYSIQFTKLSEK